MGNAVIWLVTMTRVPINGSKKSAVEASVELTCHGRGRRRTATPPRRTEARREGDATPRGRRGAIEKSFMTRDASRRLRLAKKAAKTCLAAGGSAEAAAAVAQAFGTPADGGSSDDNDDDSDAEEPDPIDTDGAADALQTMLVGASSRSISSTEQGNTCAEPMAAKPNNESAAAHDDDAAALPELT